MSTPVHEAGFAMRKSRYSNPDGSCVKVGPGTAPATAGMTAFGDTKRPDVSFLVVADVSARRFLRYVRTQY